MGTTDFNDGDDRVRAEDVISRLKDDGGFDRLRLKIIRKVKEDEQLRGNIISMVKQSAALNRPGAKNMKPRQLSDAIHQEIGDKLMSQISDSLWNVIRSPDGMNSEIKETVQSVYEKLYDPQGMDNGESSSQMDTPINQGKLEKCEANGAFETDGTQSDGEPNEPPGFGLADVHGRNKNHKRKIRKSFGGFSPSKGKALEENKGDKSNEKDLPPPGFSSVFKLKKTGDVTNEDPDVPPGFG